MNTGNPLTISTSEKGEAYRSLIDKHGAPLLVLDCQRLRDQYRALSNALPGVGLFYAVKSLPHPQVIETLAIEGAGFDIATAGEIELVRKSPVQPRQTIHTHPIKRHQDIRAALRFGCTTFVVDNEEELMKFAAYRSRVGLLLRVSFRSDDAVVDLSKKFGCAPEEVEHLLLLAKKLSIHIKGFSFHVGSQCKSPDKQVHAINICNKMIRDYHDKTGTPLSILDIGGGFPVDYSSAAITDKKEVAYKQQDIDNYCHPIREALKSLPHFVNMIAEPGRYLSAPTMTSVSTIMGKAIREEQHWYYLDDGIYGSYSGQMFDHVRYPIEVFSDRGNQYQSVLAGPTCDSIDVIAEGIDLPELQIGDLVIGHVMGAYTTATATEFNSFPKAKIIAINTNEALIPVSLPNSESKTYQKI